MLQFFGTWHVFLKNVEKYPFHKVSIHLHKHYKQIIELFFWCGEKFIYTLYNKHIVFMTHHIKTGHLLVECIKILAHSWGGGKKKEIKDLFLTIELQCCIQFTQERYHLWADKMLFQIKEISLLWWVTFETSFKRMTKKKFLRNLFSLLWILFIFVFLFYLLWYHWMVPSPNLTAFS